MGLFGRKKDGAPGRAKVIDTHGAPESLWGERGRISGGGSCRMKLTLQTPGGEPRKITSYVPSDAAAVIAFELVDEIPVLIADDGGLSVDKSRVKAELAPHVEEAKRREKLFRDGRDQSPLKGWNVRETVQNLKELPGDFRRS